MATLNESIGKYRAEMLKGDIPRAYRAIIDFMLSLRTHFRKNHSEYSVSGNFYQGTMDITFFTLVPVFFRDQRLKIVLVFNHQRIAFEGWLCGINNGVRAEYDGKFTPGDWVDYRVPPFTHSPDAILEVDLVTDPDFDHPETLIQEIARNVGQFARQTESFLYRSGAELL